MDDLGVDQRHGDVPVGGHLAQTVTEVRQPAHHVAVARGVGDQTVLVSFVQDLHAPLRLWKLSFSSAEDFLRTLRGIHQLLMKTLWDSSCPILEA